jgi:hypothetical protein
MLYFRKMRIIRKYYPILLEDDLENISIYGIKKNKTVKVLSTHRINFLVRYNKKWGTSNKYIIFRVKSL